MLRHDVSYYFMLAERGIRDGDSNCLVHSQLLLEHLQHRRKLKRRSAIEDVETKIEFEARQIERTLAAHKR